MYCRALSGIRTLYFPKGAYLRTNAWALKNAQLTTRNPSQPSKSCDFPRPIVYLPIDFQPKIASVTRLTNSLVFQSSQSWDLCHSIVYPVIDCRPEIA